MRRENRRGVRSAVTAMVVSVLLVGIGSPARGQEREDRTLLPLSQVRAVVNEVSGDRAMHHLLELAPYPRDRKAAEYESVFAESAYLKNRLQALGVDVQVETFDRPDQPIWDGERGELWLVEPEQRKLLDYHDVPAMLTSNTPSGDWTGELVDVGDALSEEDFARYELQDKIVLGNASPSLLQRRAVFDHGAAGVISVNSLRPLDPQQTLWEGIASADPEGNPGGFGFKVTPEIAYELRRLLRDQGRVVVRAVTESRTYPGRVEVVHARIPGDGSSEQEIIVSAHVFEGYAKQGANDDGSGAAAMLEIARAIRQLVADGSVPPPHRAINFLWVPEISGTIAWLQRHQDVAEHLIADLNMDMVGESLLRNRSFFTLHRTPDSHPSYLNDVVASMMEFVGNTNRERVRYRAHGYRMSYPIVSPNGTRDPFTYVIDKHYGASDHVVYLGAGIPAIILVAWPDMYYHSSQDTPDKADPTQLKRAGVIATSCALLLAGADDTAALRIAGEVMGRGDARIGRALLRAQGYLADAGGERDFIAPEGASLEQALALAYREARVVVEHAVSTEMAALRSTGVLFGHGSGREILDERLAPLAERLQDRQRAALELLRGYYELLAQAAGVAVLQPQETEAERAASQRVPLLEPDFNSFSLFRMMSRLSREQRLALLRVPSSMWSELGAFADGERSLLQIRNALAGELEPVAIEDVTAFVDVLVQAGVAQYR